MIGKTLAHYEISALLGKGGMGEVYLAHDTKLDREVAVKVLTREMSGDAERIARFRREARTLASLQHANVASVYGFEDTSEARFLVMEFVEGEDLSERLQRGALAQDEACEIARQIALGLEAAHEQGIVHRDLKPANIKVTPDGEVKILDFGLARAFLGDPGEDADLANSPTITAAMTQAGVILGTASYMSPEQARGRRIDKRADIWAFGVILWEMLSGQRMFEGETVSDTLAGVLKSDIDLSTLRGEYSTELIQLLERCLDRDPKTRLRDIGEARVILGQPFGRTVPSPTDARSNHKPLLVALALIVGLALGAGLMRTLTPTQLDPPAKRQVRLSVPRAAEGGARSALAPDGSALLSVDEGRLWIREFSQNQRREIPGTEGALVCAWSADGEWIAYSTATEIYKCRLDGSDLSRLCQVPNDLHAWAGGIRWTEDGRVLFVPGDSGVWEVAAVGGDPKVLIPVREGETDFHNLEILPGDRGILFVPHADLDFDSIDLVVGGQRRELLRMEGQQLHSPAYTGGHLLFGRWPDNQGVWAVPFSLESLQVTGEPFLVVADAGFPVVSRGGDLAYVPQSAVAMQIVRLNERGNITDQVGDVFMGAVQLRVSPDEGNAVVTLRGKDVDLWIADLTTGGQQRFTFATSENRNPSWSPAGDRILYTSGITDAGMHQELRARDGSRAQLFAIRGADPILSHDGRYLVLSVWDDANEASIGYIEVDDPEAAPTMIADSSFSESAPALAPDDRFLAYESAETGVVEVFVLTFPDASGKWQLSQGGGRNPRWSRTGDRLYFTSADGNSLMAVDVQTDPIRFGAAQELFPLDGMTELNPVSNGEFFALRRVAGGNRASIEVWLNWAESVGK